MSCGTKKPCDDKSTPLLDQLPDCCDETDNTCEATPGAFINSCTFELDDAETALFDCIAQELTSIAGVTVYYFHYDLEATSVDPLYSEPIERVFRGSYQIKVQLEYPEANPEANERGLHTTWSAVAWIPRKEIENANAPIPAEGDVIRVWDSPFFKKYSVLHQDIPQSGYFFNLTKVVEDGHIFDRSGFVGFKCDLHRVTEFTPERRIIND